MRRSAVPLARRELALCIAAAGCAARIDADRATTASLRRIALATPGAPAKAEVPMVMPPGIFLGLVGGLAEAAVQAERDEILGTALAAQRFDAGPRFAARLKTALEAGGAGGVTELAAPRQGTGFLAALPATDAEAVLDSALTRYGFIARSMTSPFIPFVSCRARLVTPAGRTLWQDQLMLNWGGAALGFTVIDGAQDFAFRRSTDFRGAEERVAAGLDAGFGVVAQAIVARLR